MRDFVQLIDNIAWRGEAENSNVVIYTPSSVDHWRRELQAEWVHIHLQEPQPGTRDVWPCRVHDLQGSLCVHETGISCLSS